MILQFSECVPDYGAYLSPYQVWAILEETETPATALDNGFLPGAYDLSHFYLARSVRVDLGQYYATGRVRYTARRCAPFTARLADRAQWEFTPEWRRLAAGYLTRRLAAAGFSPQRFAALVEAPLTTHLLEFRDTAGQPAGLVTLFLDGAAAYYGVAVYDLAHLGLGIGGHMMATALSRLKDAGYRFGYLGSCYSPGALYKSRFAGMEFFNGHRWSADRSELRFLVEHQDKLAGTHLLEFGPYRDSYYSAPLPLDGAPGLRLAGTRAGGVACAG